MITQELKDKGVSCRGKGLNCPMCKYKNECVDYMDTSANNPIDKDVNQTAINHLCNDCKTIECPKADRYNEVSEMFKFHLNAFFKGLEELPKDTEHEQYTIEFITAPAVVDCPYYQEGD